MSETENVFPSYLLTENVPPLLQVKWMFPKRISKNLTYNEEEFWDNPVNLKGVMDWRVCWRCQWNFVLDRRTVVATLFLFYI